MPDRKGARRRLGSIRLSLIMLALVPSVTLAAMWGVTTTQLFAEGLRLRSQTELSRSTGAMGTETTLALQGERAVSAAWLAKVPGSRAALDEKRAATDAAVAELVGQSEKIQQAPARITDQLYSVLGSVGSLEYYRDQVDHPTDITAEQALDQYTSIIDDQIHAFQQLSQVDDGDLTSQAGPLVALEHAAELTSQEDVALTLAWPSGHLDERAWEHFVQLVNTRRWLVEDQIVPALSGEAKTQTQRILASGDWRTLTTVEDQVLAARPAGGTGKVALPDAGKRWADAMEKVSVRYTALIRQQTSGLLTRSADKAHEQLLTAASLSAGGLIALLVCLVMSWRITRSLSRRLRGLREATLGLAQERLPDVVARLERGEKVDIDRAAPELDYGSDELGQVAKAFNAAQRTAVVTAVELADTRRGFQKVILGIARQSQNLVNLQLSRLDTLEREHQDPDVLSGLYELDSTASQLRRYEENLVIISGGRPRRSWTEPVALIDILRSAVGEVAEYQRVEVHTEEEVCLAPPAVADVIHLLAELIENATLYSPAPSPVSVRAGLVAKGLAVEVEDRGLGMSEDEYAAFNSHLSEAPKFDVVALADDLRLGMFVIARLADRHGIQVTLRSSPYGGTTAIVLIPHEIVVREENEPEGRREVTAAVSTGPAADGPDPTSAPTGAGRVAGPAGAGTSAGSERTAAWTDASRSGGRGGDPANPAADPAGVRDAESPVGTGLTADSAEAPADPADIPGPPAPDEPGGVPDPESAAGAVSGRTGIRPLPAARDTPTPRPDGLTPLPRRVPQTSLAVELRDEAPATCPEEDADEFTADRAASSLAGFQRGTLRARDEDDLLDTPQDPTARPTPTAVPEKATTDETDPLDTPENLTTPAKPQDPPVTGTHAPHDPPPTAVPEKATTDGTRPLDSPEDVTTADPHGPPRTPEAPVAARTPHTDRS
ncbi:nitrate- and nitrite sensing domain-containing protein [Streptomyces sp. NPDC005483]|uniref:sensor histidine kinase n=1 Tax=Streptomyces sp. NPDC005483 TaxID=3154882 RepID=UPI0033A80E13